jgi:hypothetical protein
MSTFWPQPKDLRLDPLKVLLCNRLDRSGLGGYVREYYFARPERRWRFDLAYVYQRLAVEIEGGGWIHGRHVRGKGFALDLEKYNEAACRGWRLIRVNGNMIEDGRAIEYVRRMLEQ